MTDLPNRVEQKWWAVSSWSSSKKIHFHIFLDALCCNLRNTISMKLKSYEKTQHSPMEKFWRAIWRRQCRKKWRKCRGEGRRREGEKGKHGYFLHVAASSTFSISPAILGCRAEISCFSCLIQYLIYSFMQYNINKLSVPVGITSWLLLVQVSLVQQNNSWILQVLGAKEG